MAVEGQPGGNTLNLVGEVVGEVSFKWRQAQRLAELI